MINTKTKLVIAISGILTASTAQAATTHTMTDGSFIVTDVLGVVDLASSHNDVQGALDLNNGLGQFTYVAPFSGSDWVADINMMTFHSSVGGGTSTAPEAQSFDWVTESWFIGGVASTCRIAGAIDNCVTENASGGLFLDTTNTATAGGGYAYSLSPGQFAAHLFLDWSSNDDIPVLSVWEIAAGSLTGSATLASVDSDGDTYAGTAMLTNPFLGQSPSISGAIVAAVPIPAAAWLFGSGLLGLIAVARRKAA